MEKIVPITRLCGRWRSYLARCGIAGGSSPLRRVVCSLGVVELSIRHRRVGGFSFLPRLPWQRACGSSPCGGFSHRVVGMLLQPLGSSPRWAALLGSYPVGRPLVGASPRWRALREVVRGDEVKARTFQGWRVLQLLCYGWCSQVSRPGKMSSSDVPLTALRGS